MNLRAWARTHFVAHRDRTKWPFFWRITIESLTISAGVSLLLSVFFEDLGRPDLERLTLFELLYATTVIAPVFETLLLQTFPIAVARALGSKFWVQVVVSAAIFASLHFLDGLQTGMCAGLVGGTYLAFTYARWREVSFGTAFLMTAGVHAASNAIAVAFLLAIGEIGSVPQKPNKAPEPTPTSVTDRAGARSAPAAAVAHL